MSKLSRKEYSPMVVRKYTCMKGLPIFVAIITDDALTDLDEFAVSFLHKFQEEGELETIQDFRNLAGALTEEITKKYPRVEGVAVVLFPDKAAVCSLWGDFMNHAMCRKELYDVIQIMTNV